MTLHGNTLTCLFDCFAHFSKKCVLVCHVKLVLQFYSFISIKCCINQRFQCEYFRQQVPLMSKSHAECKYCASLLARGVTAWFTQCTGASLAVSEENLTCCNALAMKVQAALTAPQLQL